MQLHIDSQVSLFLGGRGGLLISTKNEEQNSLLFLLSSGGVSQ